MHAVLPVSRRDLGGARENIAKGLEGNSVPRSAVHTWSPGFSPQHLTTGHGQHSPVISVFRAKAAGQGGSKSASITQFKTSLSYM